MTEIEVLVEFLFIDIIFVHDLKEFFKFFDEVVIGSRFLDSWCNPSAKELVAFIAPKKHVLRFGLRL